MLMMMRADESYTPVEGCTAEELLACVTADDYDACIAACNGEEGEEEPTDPEVWVTYGKVTVSKASFSETTVPSWIPGVAMWKIKVKAGDEDAKLSSVTLKANGYGNYANLDSVYLEDEDGNRVTRQRNVDTDGNVTLDFVSNYELKANGSVTFSIVNTINWWTNGDTYGYTVTEITGPEKVSGLPVSTDIVSQVTISNLWKLDIAANVATANVKIGKEEKLGSFKLSQATTSQEDVRLYSVVVKQDGDVDMDDLSDLYITIAGEKVTSKARVDGKYVTLTFKDGWYVIEKDKTSAITLNLMWTVTWSPAKTTKFIIEREEDIVAKWERHGYRVDLLNAWALYEVSDFALSNALTINGSEIEASFDKSEDLTTLATNDSFSFGNLKLKASDTNYEFETFTIVLTTAVDYATVAALEQEVKNVKLWDMTAASITRTAANTFEYKFEWISMNKGVQRNLPLTMKLYKVANAAQTFTFDLSLVNNKFKLVDLDADKTYTTVAAVTDIMSTTAMSTRTVSIAWWSLTLTVNAMNTNSFVTANGKEIVVAKWKLEAGNNTDVKVTDITFTNAGTVNPLSDFVSKAVLTVDGEKYNSTSINAATIEFDREIEIAKWKKPEFELTLTLKKWNTAVLPKSLAFKINAAADVVVEDKEWNAIVWGNKIISTTSFGTFNLISLWTISVNWNVENDNSTGYAQFVNKDKYVIAGTENVSLARVKVFAEKENARVKTIQFNVLTNSADNLIESLKDVRLVNGEDSYSASIAKVNATNITLTFTDIDTIINQGSAQYLYLVADYNTIDPNSPNGTSTAWVTAKVDAIVVANSRFIWVDSSLDLATTNVDDLNIDSKTTTVVANVPAEFTLVWEDNGNITAIWDYKLATLTIKPDAQTVNKNAQWELLKATLSDLTAKIWTSAGVAATYSVKKVWWTNSAVLNDDDTISSMAALLTEATIEANGTTFEIWANITNVGSRADWATFTISIDPMTNNVVVKDWSTTPQTTKINLADGVSTRLNATTGK